MLDKKYHVDEKTGFKLRYVKSTTEYFRPHYHNYVEIFLMLRGSCRHRIGDAIHTLHEGYLLLIRDFDIHDYACIGEEEFHMLNLAIEKECLLSACSYLGDGFDKNALLDAKEPPCIILSKRQKEKLFYALMELNGIENAAAAKTKMRATLVHILTAYFQDYTEARSDIPLWLEITYEKMQKPENFIRGGEQMLAISGKTREHLARSMQKYYHTTPTAYLNELRLNYAVNLLQSSNLSVTDICFECGFTNLSWFYQLFEREFHMRPAQFRKARHS